MGFWVQGLGSGFGVYRVYRAHGVYRACRADRALRVLGWGPMLGIYTV